MVTGLPTILVLCLLFGGAALGLCALIVVVYLTTREGNEKKAVRHARADVDATPPQK
jgi:hypothetical protein